VYLCGFVAAFPVAVWVWTFDTSRHIGTCCVMKLFCYHKLLLYSVQYNSWLVVFYIKLLAVSALSNVNNVV